MKLNCPQCGGFNVELYKIKSNNPFLQQDYYICIDCGNIWKEKIHALPNLNTRKKEKIQMKINKIKNERLKYLKWGKLRMNDVVDALIDLFELGGGKFSKRKKRNLKNENKNKRNSSGR